MARLLIGNDFNEDIRKDRTFAGWWVQRLVWFARDGDVLVLPEQPEEFFLGYITALTGVRHSTLRVVVPPPGRAGTALLTADRLADPAFLDELSDVIATCDIDEIFPLWPDAPVAALATSLGLAPAMPGHGFIDQGGGVLVNSKPVFRAIAGGIGLPVPRGGVVANLDDAVEAVVELLDSEAPVILKQAYLSGGHGNEILSPVEGVRPFGARQVTVVTDRAAVRAYLADGWQRLTAGGRGPVVVEQYHRDSPAVFAEFLLTDAGIEFSGQGEMLPSAFAAGEIMPAFWLKPDTLTELIDGAYRLCQPVHAMGYRGYLSGDAIVTPDQRVLYTEFNGRVSGSTHIYDIVGKRVVGPDYVEDRILLERAGWSVPSFQAAAEALAAAGFAYDPAARTGVVLLNAVDPQYGTVIYCVIAENLDAALNREQELTALFASVGA
jgi:hypothetical protein